MDKTPTTKAAAPRKRGATASAKSAAPAAKRPAPAAKAKAAATRSGTKATAGSAEAKKTSRRKAVKVTPEQRYRMIAEGAYYRAEQSGFKGDAVAHWLAAEQEVEAQLAAVRH